MESLPPEILNKVLEHFTVDTVNTRECTLVCSTWKRLFEKLLYSSIKLHSFSHLLKLLDTLKSNKELGGLVWKLSFCFALDYKETAQNENISALFTHLPNLMCIDFSKELGVKYILEALKASKLPHLKRIEHPIKDEDRADYTACALIMKNRLENLSIENPANRVFFDEDGRPRLELDENHIPLPNDSEERVRQRNEGSELFHRLFDVLDEFRHVNDLQLSTKVNNDDVDLLEQVTKACPLLEKLEVESYMDPEANDIPRAGSDVVNRDVLPAHKVRQLTLRKKGALHYSLFTKYIISKFPALESLVIKGRFNPSLHWNQLEFRELMQYISNIKDVSLDRIPLERSGIDTVRSLWEAKRSPSRAMTFAFNYDGLFDQHMGQLSIKFDDSHINTTIHYKQLAADLPHSDIIEQYGECISALRFWDAPRPSPEGFNVYDSHILQPLRHCPKLERLTIIGCRLAGFNIADLHNIARREKFDTLNFFMCTFESSSAFECLPELFPSVDKLEFRAPRFNNRLANATSFNFHLAEMDIGSFSFSTHTFFPVRRRNHKLLIKLTTKIGQCYFMYDVAAKDLILKSVNQQDFEDLRENSESFLIDFRFKSVKSFTIQHLIWKLKTIEILS